MPPNQDGASLTLRLAVSISVYLLELPVSLPLLPQYSNQEQPTQLDVWQLQWRQVYVEWHLNLPHLTLLAALS
jgi:hypothetical protein